MEVATDLYVGLQKFFGKYQDLQPRPLFITGESYAGKYVPSIGAHNHLHFLNDDPFHFFAQYF